MVYSSFYIPYNCYNLLVNKKKLCGILQEIVFYDKQRFAIIGIGINTNNNPVINSYPTTYLNAFRKKKIKNSKVYNEINKNFENYLK